VSIRTSGYASAVFMGCDLQHVFFFGGLAHFHACKLNQSSYSGGSATLLSCYLDGTQIMNSCVINIDGDCIRNYDNDTSISSGEMIKVRAGGVVNVGYACAFDGSDGTDDGILVEPGGTVWSQDIHYGGHLVWGGGYSGVGIKTMSGAKFLYDTTKPTISGTVGNTKVAGTVIAYADIPLTGTNVYQSMITIAQ